MRDASQCKGDTVIDNKIHTHPETVSKVTFLIDEKDISAKAISKLKINRYELTKVAFSCIYTCIGHYTDNHSIFHLVS